MRKNDFILTGSDAIVLNFATSLLLSQTMQLCFCGSPMRGTGFFKNHLPSATPTLVPPKDVQHTGRLPKVHDLLGGGRRRKEV
jgi:hypothetical protein